MNPLDEIKKPSKEEQQVALESYNALDAVLKQISAQNPEIEIEETKEKIKIPIQALRLLSKILQATAQGKPISIVPLAMEVTTQSAADFLGCSRPHLVKLLEKGVIPFTRVGRHRRVKFEDLQKYKKAMKTAQKKLLIEMMKQDEDYNMYAS
ncbi:MAG: helix-turn-helix domain-containing protein [Cyclobacteriaceae bacterium]|nr:helix-turn-helix domain-containing protein [Cyclobacteriaceae bacterium]MCB0498331.1 helix-turn-helix domain-containing protein [Cyclobacteriaceae bacterium]MCB9239055.1 helix-turn-helix domain-containing protein [Flammeovirgaceae bacterium]MCO5271081.1 helix-turn-helix domain-containing protein [Cyclobacteriaceae bacterium]MCW5903485.1 helix-turn-helix domain-containing protein [Cyclobacteriaceae bacterium]